ncbi:unnamed protein product [Taenia asiatica]|uniref:Geranylgeranyl pyrophosphate synthase n=1 Tax=Taenia asiatica TaxID=60517 RepID=A0A0R3WD34_TAEAS|nr:unnamed protein product [Taenia asiatica]
MLFGVPLSINAANYAYFIALEKALTLEHPDVPKIFAKQMVNLHRGQGLDIYWRCSLKCPSEEEYKDMVIRKTGGLFGMAVNFMQLFSTNTTDYKPLLDALGLWFQIRDDFANLVDTSYHEAKDFADDLTEGKFSFPVVHAINSCPHDQQVMAILRQRTSNRAVKEHCIQHLRKLGSLAHTARTLIELELELASEGSDSEKVERRRFELHYDSLNDSEEKSHVPTGLEMFSAYRQGILNPDIVSTQAAISKVGEGKKGNEANASGAVKVPPAWLKPRGVLGRLASGHVPTTTSVPSSSSAPAIPITAAQKIAYEPPSIPTKAGAPIDSKNLLVSQRQRGNPLLELIRHVTWEYAAIEPDYVFGPSQCAFFLSLRYHNLNPEYIFKRLQKLKSTFQLIVLIVLVDVTRAAPLRIRTLASLSSSLLFEGKTLTTKTLIETVIELLFILYFWTGRRSSSFERAEQIWSHTERHSTACLEVPLLFCPLGPKFGEKEEGESQSSFFMPPFLSYSFLEAARYVECFKALVNKPPEELQPEVAIATAQKDQLTLATDFFTSLRVVSRSDAAALLSRFGTVSDIIKADRKMLESCPGIGTVKAERIYEALHSSLKRKDSD